MKEIGIKILNEPHLSVSNKKNNDNFIFLSFSKTSKIAMTKVEYKKMTKAMPPKLNFAGTLGNYKYYRFK